MWIDIRILLVAKFENVAEFIVVRVKGSFSIFVGKLKNSWIDGIF